MRRLVVRPAAGSDADAIAAISRRPFAASWTRAAYAAEAGREDSLLLVAEDEAVRGYALARVTGLEAQLLDLAVAEDGRGTGRALWKELTAAATRRGARLLTLEVSIRNGRAVAFYERGGARVVGRRPKFYNDGSDAILMDLPLP